MARSFELLQTRERLRVGQRFLSLRPKIAAVGAIGNGILVASSPAPFQQRLVLAMALGGTVVAFFVEAWWLERHPLTERWLLTSLGLTLLALACGATLSGGLQSPILPLLFTPVIVGFAAFARSANSALLFVTALVSLLLMSVIAPLSTFSPIAMPWGARMLFVSSVVSLALLFVGVIGLVDAHARIAAELGRIRTDMLFEAERRAASVEHLGAQVAHEVKNPLTAARGLVQLVQRKASDPSDQKRLSVVVSEVDRALDVLKGYLSFARPLTELSLAEVNLRALLEDVVGVIEARAHEQHVRVFVLGDPVSAIVDRQRLRDATLNLALNAINAMPEGGDLEFMLAQTPTHIRVQVADNGSGMSEEMLEHIGKPFASESEGGTGLGVLVARSVARQHGGDLLFESTRGVGTRATLELPKAFAMLSNSSQG